MTTEEIAKLIVAGLSKAPGCYVCQLQPYLFILDGSFDILKVAEVVMDKVSEYVDEARREAALEEAEEWC